jgi:acetoin utilization protein AcuC
MQAALFYTPRVLRFDYGRVHPFQVARLGDVIRLCEALDLLPHGKSPIVPNPCSRADLDRFHSCEYLDLLEMTATEGLRESPKFGLGSSDNPIFPGLWLYCLTVAGGSIEAALWIAAGREIGLTRRAFHPAGGLHHAHADRASGFCYVNDGALAIERLVSAGLRVLYVDVDAHHGDGVQEAFYASDRVMAVSIHQDGRTLFPGTGFPNESGVGEGVGYSVNVPVLPGAGDDDYERFREEILVPLVKRFRPDVLVTEIGVDSLRDDPLTLLDWTLSGLNGFLEWCADTGLPWLALGGGGYRRWNVIRGWTAVWARMIGRDLPIERPRIDRSGPLPDSWPLVLSDESPPRAVCDLEMRMAHYLEVRSYLERHVFPLVRGGG